MRERKMGIDEELEYYRALHTLSSNHHFKVIVNKLLLDRVELQRSIETEYRHPKLEWMQGVCQHLRLFEQQIENSAAAYDALYKIKRQGE